MYKAFTTFFLATATFFHLALFAGQGISLAAEYQKNSSLQWRWATESLQNFAFQPQDKVLDVGCGDGKITSLIANMVPNGVVIGLDISEKMLHQATLTCQSDHTLFIQGTATDLPFKGQFDKIVSFCTLHWVLDQKRAIQSITEALKPNGQVLLVFPGKVPNNIMPLAEKVVASEKWKSHFPAFKQERVYFTVEEYGELLSETNLEIISITGIPSVTEYKDTRALVNWLRPLINFIDHLTPDLKEEFIEEIAQQMLLVGPATHEGSIALHDIKIEVIATKK